MSRKKTSQYVSVFSMPTKQPAKFHGTGHDLSDLKARDVTAAILGVTSRRCESVVEQQRERIQARVACAPSQLVAAPRTVKQEVEKCLCPELLDKYGHLAAPVSQILEDFPNPEQAVSRNLRLADILRTEPELLEEQNRIIGEVLGVPTHSISNLRRLTCIGRKLRAMLEDPEDCEATYGRALTWENVLILIRSELSDDRRVEFAQKVCSGEIRSVFLAGKLSEAVEAQQQ